MAFQGRHQTWSGLHKINSGFLEGQGEEGVSVVWSGLIYKCRCPAHSPSCSPGCAGSGNVPILLEQVPSSRARASRPHSWGAVLQRVLALSQLCLWWCWLGHKISLHCRWRQEWLTLPGSVLGPWVSGCLEGGRLQVVQAQFCCPDGQALAQGRGEVHHSPVSPAALLGCLDSPPTTVHWGI